MKGVTHQSFRAVAVLAGVVIGTVAAQDLEITRTSIDGGGVMRSTGGEFELSSTIGQPDAGVMNGGDFQLTGGFWIESNRLTK